MKVILVLLLIGVAVASELRWVFNEKVTDVRDKQYDINELYTGLANDDFYQHVPKDFPYADTKYYKVPAALEKFITAWKEGFITKDSYFSLYSYKNRHDTYRFFDVLYFAKDYDTFIKIAKWGKSELHPLQFVYAFTAAIFHRHDTRGLAIPHLYEVLPHYYLPSDIVQGTYKAYILGVGTRKFDVNTTGFEYSWYKGKTMESFKSGPKWNVYDTESRLSYFTEDVGLADAISKNIIAHAPWISDEKYPEIYTERKGEILFDFYKYLLKKYNLERYANNLPPVEPVHYKVPIKTGYSPHMVTIHGHPFTSRPDGFVLFASNPDAVDKVMITHERYDTVTDLKGYWNPSNNSFTYIDDTIQGLNTLGELVYGVSHPKLRAIYKPLHYQAFDALDTGVRSSNDIGITGSVLSNYLTEMRDPVFYRVLASVYQTFQNYFTKLQPYSLKELGFAGVKITDFQTSKLETFFENFDYDITNTVPFKRSNRGDYQYTASKTRLNHKPFNFKFTIHSDKEQDAIIRVFLTPSLDSNGRPLGIAEKFEHAVGFYIYNFKLKKGVNTFAANSLHGFYSEENSLRNITQTLKKLKSTNEPYFVPSVSRCNVPSNLVLPKGSQGGKPYSLFSIVSPYTSHGSEEAKCPCGYDLVYGTDYPLDFPTNRRPISAFFEQLDNVYFKDVYIYHNDQKY